jgi:D-alanine-D-alanine ligase
MDLKPTVAFITGGYSGEAVVSYESAKTIEANLDSDLFDVYKIDISPGGWFYETAGGKQVAVDRSDFSLLANNRKVTFDVVFVGIHGTPAEDGKLLAYFDLLNIPYTACNAATSSLTFNKRYTVAVAAFAGIDVARSVHIFKNTSFSVSDLSQQLKFPVFVKPNNGGSSIGMSKVNDDHNLGAAIDKAFAEDDQVLIEEFVSGREFTIGVFTSNAEIITLPITEVISKKDFFDYEAKYTAGMSEEITPAEITEEIAEKVRMAAKKIYQVFNCRGVVRIDFIYNEATRSPYMLEVNTVPGQSAASIVPKQVSAMGWTLKQFYTALIREVLGSRHHS